MNCKDISKIMPELAAGEIYGEFRKKADNHLACCKMCADKFAEYADAMNALASPHEMAAVPRDLVMPSLPAARKSWVYVLPVAAVLIILVTFLTIPYIRRVPEPIVVAHHDSGNPVSNNYKPEQNAADKPVANVAVNQDKPVKKITIAADKQSKTIKIRKKIIPVTPDYANETVNQNSYADAVVEPADDDIIASEKQTKNPGFVIVSRRDEQPPQIEITSVDYSTGSVTSYSSTIDNDGNEQSVLITSSPATDEDIVGDSH
ncbi:MAG: hypothetical protein ACYC27_11835 [Armatimonadota bacterium]